MEMRGTEPDIWIILWGNDTSFPDNYFCCVQFFAQFSNPIFVKHSNSGWFLAFGHGYKDPNYFISATQQTTTTTGDKNGS